MKYFWPLIATMLPALAIAEEPASLRDDMKGLSLYEHRDYNAAAEALHNDYRKGVALYKAGKYAEAAEAFKQAAPEEKQPFPALYNWGNSQFQQHDYQGAINAYTAALAAKPKDPDATYNLELAKKMLRQQQQKQQGGGGGQGKPNEQQGGGSGEGKPQDGKPEQGEGGSPYKPEQGNEGQQADSSPGEKQGDKDQQGNQQNDRKPDEQPPMPSDYIMNQLSTNPAELAKKRMQMDEMNDRQAQRNSMKLDPW
ncbi:tetratricopeptide repeat protein [bacterium]|nr:tetratricopeptide repeat protein [bacterium]